MVICEDDATGTRDMVTNPVLVVEVLSPSSERWDRVGKFTQYRRVNGLREYVLVSQDEMLVEWYTRRDNDDWVYRQAAGPDAICHLEQLAVDIPVANLYRKITFPEL
jgi:Uma2 family endonuclease